MNNKDRIEYLIVDTSAFIKNAPLQDIGNNIITEQDVVDEIKNKRQLRRLVVLPYDLTIQTAFSENIQFVTEFAKKTGDYASLSATDIKVIALTYQLEKEKVGTDHLKDAPTIPKTVDTHACPPEDYTKPVVGFYSPQEEKSDTDCTKENQYKEFIEEYITKNDDGISNENPTDVDKPQDSNEEELSDEESSDYESAVSDAELEEATDLNEKFAKLTCEPSELEIVDGKEHAVDEILAPLRDCEGEQQEDSAETDEYNEEEDSDNEGWITPSNIKDMKKKMDSDIIEEKPATVACLTMDFAMQNVLKQIGLNVASLDGKVIKQMRTFIFRCYACFKTTSIMTHVFCPNCGYKTLRKVAVSVDDDGKQKIHINYRKPISTKGKRFSLPMPKGGKHANNPILCADQPLPDQRPTRLARTKTDPLHDDYIAGYSPFVMRDVNSKSAMLGIRSNNAVKYWMRRNPNEPKRKKK